MGMRMACDLQRNLDLMKEIELERTHAVKTGSAQSEMNRNKVGSTKSIDSEQLHVQISHEKSGNAMKLNEKDQQAILNDEASMQISFEVDEGNKFFDSDDDVFASLVGGQTVKIPSPDNVTSKRQTTSGSVSDSDWEGVVERGADISNDLTLESNPPVIESNIIDDREVEWEDGDGDNEKSFFPSASTQPASRGDMEEEANLNEAIRRSLVDQGGEPFMPEMSKLSQEISCEDVRFLYQDDFTSGPPFEKGMRQQVMSENLATRKKDRVDDSRGVNEPSRVLRCSCSARLITNSKFVFKLGKRAEPESSTPMLVYVHEPARALFASMTREFCSEHDSRASLLEPSITCSNGVVYFYEKNE